MPTGLKIREPAETLGRRHFFRSFAGRAIAAVQEIGGSPQLRLDQMAGLPDQVIRTLRPVMDTVGPYRIQGNRLVCMEGSRAAHVYSFEPWETAAMGLFDGCRTLVEIAPAFASARSLSTDEAYRDLKSLFIALASYMVCRPANTAPENATDAPLE